MFEYFVTRQPKRNITSKPPLFVEKSETIEVSDIFVYKVQGHDQIILFQGHHKDKGDNLIGIICLGGTCIIV